MISFFFSTSILRCVVKKTGLVALVSFTRMSTRVSAPVMASKRRTCSGVAGTGSAGVTSPVPCARGGGAGKNCVQVARSGKKRGRSAGTGARLSTS
nr:MAG: hypothetical protein [Molluscum contagiosum virus]